jgi:hypothetical protein
VSYWPDNTTVSDIRAIKRRMTTQVVPMLANMTSERDSGAYSNEADAFEPNFQTTLFGTNYARLGEIKRMYDPEDLFIVTAGVGSERWTLDGMCTNVPGFSVQ